jgi:excisionase family DNA binding protein
MTVDDVAARLGVGRRTVLGWLRDGSLNGVRLGGTRAGWRIRDGDLAQFIDDRATRPRTATATT